MTRGAKTGLVVALVAVVAMAFRVSWNALKDIAGAVGADPTAALLYPFVVDGLMALALIATLVLDADDRKFALRVLAGYTLASLVLNYVHGLIPELHASTQRVQFSDRPWANWTLVLLATSLPVGSIYFGSDLVAKVLHHQPQTTDTPDGEAVCGEARAASAQHPHTMAESPARPTKVLPEAGAATVDESPAREAYAQATGHAAPSERDARTADPHTARTADADTPDSAAFEEAELERTRQDARRTYSESVQAGHPLSARALGEAYGLSESWGRKQILAVRDDHSRPQLVAVGK
ncbi:DUF2637 domain-containing protein [Streptomyces sp. Pv4-95]|uniref:DUF2637 domain-containing protein n=1 Tax=Streptomyces sp. Pv4-95 TaxID=3049543 RepID=UPI0038924632